MNWFKKYLITTSVVFSLSTTFYSSKIDASSESKKDYRDNKELLKEVKEAEKRIPSGDQYRCPQREELIKQYGLPVKVFSYIMWRESRCKIKVVGWNYKKGMGPSDCKRSPIETYKRCDAISSYDSGLFQINSSWVTLTNQVCKTKWGNLRPLRKKDCNMKMAQYLFYNAGGLQNWGF